MKICKVTATSAEVRRLCARGAAPSPEIEKVVRAILQSVREEGMPAVLRFAREFDGLQGNLRVRPSEIKSAAQKVAPPLARALRKAISNVRKYHKCQLEESWAFQGAQGEILGQWIRPMKRVGIYVPGGAGSYPSSLIMAAVAAQVAGVPELVVVTPSRDGLNQEVAFCLQELGIEEVYKVGGAQAVGLLAYGAGKVHAVDKIVGPANVYAALAKREVFGVVDIDMIAGPSEILVLADDTADPDWVACDLLSQAEHGSGWEAAICITTSARLAKEVAECVAQQVENSPRKKILETALERFGRILVVADWKQGIAITNRIAPEHLEIMTANPLDLMGGIENAGAIFLGPWSSEPVGDYFAGPNHVLPTNGTARFSSPLGVYDFVKRTSIIQYTPKAAQANAKSIAAIANAEGFYHHAQAVLKRL